MELLALLLLLLFRRSQNSKLAPQLREGASVPSASVAPVLHTAFFCRAFPSILKPSTTLERALLVGGSVKVARCQ